MTRGPAGPLVAFREGVSAPSWPMGPIHPGDISSQMKDTDLRMKSVKQVKCGEFCLGGLKKIPAVTEGIPPDCDGSVGFVARGFFKFDTVSDHGRVVSGKIIRL